MDLKLLLLKYVDVGFMIISGMLFVAYTFLTTHLNSKFFIFFIYNFANIFCYSVILNNQYNFSYITMLNIVFMLIIIFYYIIIDINDSILPVDYISRSNFRYIIILMFFIISFFSILSIFSSFNKQKELLNAKTEFSPVSNNKVIIRNKDEIKKEHNIKIKIEEFEVENKEKNKLVVYKKSLDSLKDVEKFNYLNILIFIYIIFLNINYFLVKNKNER